MKAIQIDNALIVSVTDEQVKMRNEEWRAKQTVLFSENTGNGIHYVDAQNPNMRVRDYLKDARPSSVMLVRTDNLKISDRAKYFVKPNQK